MGEYIFQLHSVYNWKDPFQQGLGHLKSDEIVVLLRGVAILRDLNRIETKLRLQVRRFVLSIAYRLAKFRPQLRILDGNGLVDCRVAGDIRRIVRQRAESEGILVGILAFEQ